MAGVPNWAFIDNITLQGWQGRLSYIQVQIDDYARIGQIGSGSQGVGQRSRKCQIRAWAGRSSKLDAMNAADYLEGLQGYVVTVGDDFGRVFQRCRIYSMTASIQCGRGSLLQSGGVMNYKIEIDTVIEALP